MSIVQGLPDERQVLRCIALKLGIVVWVKISCRSIIVHFVRKIFFVKITAFWFRMELEIVWVSCRYVRKFSVCWTGFSKPVYVPIKLLRSTTYLYSNINLNSVKWLSARHHANLFEISAVHLKVHYLFSVVVNFTLLAVII